jgi:hypothetical protein
VVLERRRVVIAEGIRQPYHAAEPLALAEAEALIRRCREEALERAVAAVGDFGATCAGVLVGRARELPELKEILQSHAAVHTAEGIFYREVWIEACLQRGLRVTRVVEAEVAGRTAGLPRLAPPWTADEKLACLAGWAALGESSPRRRGAAS